MTLLVDIRHRQGDFSLEAAFESGGRLTALFGPSGSGKTTLVNIVGGLIRPLEGRVVAGGRVLVDTASRVFVPAHRRRVGYVFQDARLFPHLSVRSNLLYGRRFAPRAERAATDFDAVVGLLDIGHLLARRPASLSGGEKQRVAVGRALLAAPRLILMDEPLASLDEARKAEILPYVERLRDEARVPIVYVSHSVAEVTRLATDIAVLKAGRLAAFGPTAEILARLDLLSEEAGEGGAVLDMAVREQDRAFAMTVLRSAAGEIRVPAVKAPLGSRLRVRLRARDVMLATERPRGISALNVLSGVVAAIEPVSDNALDIRLDCNGEPVVARITRLSAERLKLAPGQPVFAIIKTVSVEPAGATPGG